MTGRTLTCLPAALMLLFITISCNSDGPDSLDPELRSGIDSVSYSLGYFYGSSVAEEGIDDFHYDNFLKGLKTAVEGESPTLNESQMQMAMQNYQMQLQQRQQDRQGEQARQNEEEAQLFLADNREQDDIEETESGLQYRVIEEGDGDRPSAESTVRVHYRGTLLSGEEFDSSYERGDPAEFPLNRVIQGWTEGLQLMSVGSTYEFYIPSELGYGQNPPPGGPIQPGSLLVFEVELLDILD
jgi:FKBP-type peptidyl-prolyl cis-trans isomerase